MRILCGLIATLLLVACPAIGPIDDGSSLSRGWSNRGRLVHGMRLPARGDGYLVPPVWASRGNSWGTEEMVALIVRAARRVAREEPGASLYVADLSPRRGGASEWHHSHQSGRDADLIYFAVDEKGRPAEPPQQMIPYGADGLSPAADDHRRPLPRLRFDTRRNWLLVRALLEDPAVEVQWIFMYAPLKKLLLDYAVGLGEPRDLIERADAVLRQPEGALPHDDHMHVRVFCAPDDRALGCSDRGPYRWFRKNYKYLRSRDLSVELPASALIQAARPFCLLPGSAIRADL